MAVRSGTFAPYRSARGSRTIGDVDDNGSATGRCGPALTFRHYDGRNREIRPEFPGLRANMRSLVAFTEDGSLAGEIRWLKTGGEIALVWVLEPYQRLGIATRLFLQARRRQPDLHHSSELSEAAQAWIKSLPAADERAGFLAVA